MAGSPQIRIAGMIQSDRILFYVNAGTIVHPQTVRRFAGGAGISLLSGGIALAQEAGQSATDSAPC